MKIEFESFGEKAKALQVEIERLNASLQELKGQLNSIRNGDCDKIIDGLTGLLKDGEWPAYGVDMFPVSIPDTKYLGHFMLTRVDEDGETVWAYNLNGKDLIKMIDQYEQGSMVWNEFIMRLKIDAF